MPFSRNKLYKDYLQNRKNNGFFFFFISCTKVALMDLAMTFFFFLEGGIIPDLQESINGNF